MCNVMRIYHSSSDSFPFMYSGSMSSASGSVPGTVTVSLERLVGFDIIQPMVREGASLPPTICLYQYGILDCSGRSLVNCKSAVCSGLGPVLIRSYQLRQP